MLSQTYVNGSTAIKLDMNKAYNGVQWAFLKQIMLTWGSMAAWAAVVVSGVKSTSFSFIVSREPKGVVSPSRGLHQGDLLSLYLFLFMA